MQIGKVWLGALSLSTAVACSPILDWREFQPEGSGAVVSFPCRPDRHARNVVVAGVSTRMEMWVCEAGEATYALSFINVADLPGANAALADLRAVAAANLGSAVATPSALHVPGMTPNPQTARVALAGHRPDGTPIEQQAAFFSKGQRVYQASVVGTKLSADAFDMFFAALRLPL